MKHPIRQYFIRMPADKSSPTLSEKQIDVTASVWYNRGLQVEIKSIILNETKIVFRSLPPSLQEKLKEELRLAELARRNYGCLYCSHNKYLVRELCQDCFRNKSTKINGNSETNY